MPRSVSIGQVAPGVGAADAPSTNRRPSVLLLGSPGCAIRSNVQISAPVRAFQARITGEVPGVIRMSLIHRRRRRHRRAQIDEAAAAELRHQPAALRIERDQPLLRRAEEARRRRRVAGPVGQAAARAAVGLELPELRAGRRIEREHAVLRGHVHHAVDHQRRALEEPALVAGVKRPRLLQRLHVAGVDLIERRVFRRAGILADLHPVLLRADDGRGQCRSRHPANDAFASTSRSEVDLQRELHDARIAGALDLAEARAVERRHRRVVVHVVDDVEDLPAELEVL